MNSLESEFYPESLKLQLRQLGARIRLARQRRKLRQSDLAERSRVSKSTVEKIEKGEPATSIGAYALVLWALQLDKEIDLIADAGLDHGGLIYSVTEKRVRPTRKIDNDF